MRTYFTTAEANRRGITKKALQWGERRGRWRRIQRGVYGTGPEEPNELDHAIASVLTGRGPAQGELAGALHGLDSVHLGGYRPRRRQPVSDGLVTVGNIQCADGVQTMVDLAATLDDLQWEQALESALRKELLVVEDLLAVLPRLAAARIEGTARIRRVLALRPNGAPPTESMLETLAVQLIRATGLPDPVRQYKVFDGEGRFAGRPDLCWPWVGAFLELDGQQHRDQPVYDAHRETAIVTATGWLCGRATWHQIVRVPRTTSRELVAFYSTAAHRVGVVMA